MGGGRVFNPFPGAGGFDWSISRFDAGGLDGSLAVVGARFPWGVFVPVHPCAAHGVWECNQVGGGAGAGFFAAVWMLLLVVPGTGSMLLKVLGYSPCRSQRLRSTCCGSNLALSVAVGRATELVGYVHQIPGKSLLVPPSGIVVDANIIVSPVDHNDLSFSDSH
jgi:hypothetical protein